LFDDLKFPDQEVNAGKDQTGTKQLILLLETLMLGEMKIDT
jgi:hypothetical protein